ncbi:uncharacterized protein V1516DRAFT_375306 [Lipomyces oligophaga]|uniref:uncharacterized protein n=1 Tax=Lipomyces oligophaga TaxID=45792 RepID=UPI0034CF2AD1
MAFSRYQPVSAISGTLVSDEADAAGSILSSGNLCLHMPLDSAGNSMDLNDGFSYTMENRMDTTSTGSALPSNSISYIAGNQSLNRNQLLDTPDYFYNQRSGVFSSFPYSGPFQNLSSFDDHYNSRADLNLQSPLMALSTGHSMFETTAETSPSAVSCSTHSVSHPTLDTHMPISFTSSESWDHHSTSELSCETSSSTQSEIEMKPVALPSPSDSALSLTSQESPLTSSPPEHRSLSSKRTSFGFDSKPTSKIQSPIESYKLGSQIQISPCLDRATAEAAIQIACSTKRVRRRKNSISEKATRINPDIRPPLNTIGSRKPLVLPELPEGKTKDDLEPEELAEYKHVHRLLRNRVAALASREKKRLYIEHLERENEKLSSQLRKEKQRICDLESLTGSCNRSLEQPLLSHDPAFNCVAIFSSLLFIVSFNEFEFC